MSKCCAGKMRRANCSWRTMKAIAAALAMIAVITKATMPAKMLFR